MVMNWAYVAGIFDGEGNLCMPLAHKSLLLSITQAGSTGMKLLTEIQSFLLTNSIKSRIETRNPTEGRQIVHRLLLSSLNIDMFMPKVFPYLIVKKLIAQDLIRFRALYPSLTTSPQGKFFRLELSTRGRKDHCRRGHLYRRGISGRLWCSDCQKAQRKGVKQMINTLDIPAKKE